MNKQQKFRIYFWLVHLLINETDSPNSEHKFYVYHYFLDNWKENTAYSTQIEEF